MLQTPVQFGLGVCSSVGVPVVGHTQVAHKFSTMVYTTYTQTLFVVLGHWLMEKQIPVKM